MKNQLYISGKRPLKPLNRQQSANTSIQDKSRKKPREIKELVYIPERSMWKVVVDRRFKNCEKIHPMQQKKVRTIIDELQTDRNVVSITVFGSSVSGKCHRESDVDLYIKLQNNRKINFNISDFTYDIWTNFTVDAMMMEEINKKGVVVYERNAA